MIVDRALAELSPVFDAMYAANGRASILPDRLLEGCLLIALYSIRSERQLCEHEVAPRFFQAVLAQAKAARLISAEHFWVEGTLLEAWAYYFWITDSAGRLVPRPSGSGGACWWRGSAGK